MRVRSKRTEAIHQLLSEAKGPLSANELWQSLQSSGIGLATIYRALKAGVASGELQEATLPGGQTRYEPATRLHHHHFLCSSCGRAFDLEGCVSGIEAILPPNFAMTGHEILLFGVCADCAEAA
jgi:Fur family ferric uptake transcriptional regulator